MQKIIYLKNFESKKIGDIEIISNNIAHGLIESKIVRIYDGRKIFKAPSDKMMRPETRAERKVKQRIERRTKQRYQIK